MSPTIKSKAPMQQRTRSAVTPAASRLHLSIAAQQSHQWRPSLSFRSLAVSLARCAYNKMKWVLAALIAASVVAGCSRTNSQSDLPAPKFDISTADRALKTYWALRDWTRQRARDRGAAPEAVRKLQYEEAQMNRVLTGSLASDPKNIASAAIQIELFSREIIEVTNQTASRAIIIANIKNVTPVPPDMQPEPFQLEERKNGKLLKYVLEKVDDGWRVARIYVTDDQEGWRDSSLNRPLSPSFPYDTLLGE